MGKSRAADCYKPGNDPTFSYIQTFINPIPVFATSCEFHSPCAARLSAMQNGASYHRETVADIKASAKETTLQVRGASALNLLTSARSQIRFAQDREKESDLKSALSAFTKAASLLQMVMDSSELKAESQAGKKGALFKQFIDFQNVRRRFLFIRV